MIRVAVVDDEPLARRGVIARISAFDDLILSGEYVDGPSALAGLAAHPSDIAFIDIQMPGMSGLDVLSALATGQRPLAILLTAHDTFAVRAFALNAVDYLLKPIDDHRFAEALHRARQILTWQRQVPCGEKDPEVADAWIERFSVRIGTRNVFVHVEDVQWVEADGDYAALHAGSKTYIVREPIHRLSVRLDPARFVRVHRSAIVRLDQVAELQPLTNRDAMLRLKDGTPLRVSRTYIDALLQSLHVRGESPA